MEIGQLDFESSAGIRHSRKDRLEHCIAVRRGKWPKPWCRPPGLQRRAKPAQGERSSPVEHSNASAPTDRIRRGPEAKPEKLAPSELWIVELVLDLAGWKPALPDRGGVMRSCNAGLRPAGFGAQENVQRRALPAFVGREAYTTIASTGPALPTTGLSFSRPDLRGRSSDFPNYPAR